MSVRILIGDVRQRLLDLPDGSVHCCVTSPPYYGLRDYGVAGQIGLEASPAAYVDEMVAVFREVWRVMRGDGTLWLNLGDSYNNRTKVRGSSHQPSLSGFDDDNWAERSSRGGVRMSNKPGLKDKDLIGIPWAVAFALRNAGWWLRDAIVWAKPNGMPGSQEDRCTSSYEMVFLLSKSARYWSDFDAIKTPPRESSLIRAAQDLQAQAGSHRANGGGKTNGPMKAVGVLSGSPHGRHALGDAAPEHERRTDKQRGHSRPHSGFNDRWDAMPRAEQQSRPVMMRNVWFIAPAQFAEAHFAVMPDELARRCILAGCPAGGTVLDPFCGAGTTALVADRLGRNAVTVEINPEYAEIARRRIVSEASLLSEVEVAA